jgi:hypothetical protein
MFQKPDMKIVFLIDFPIDSKVYQKYDTPSIGIFLPIYKCPLNHQQQKISISFYAITGCDIFDVKI